MKTFLHGFHLLHFGTLILDMWFPTRLKGFPELQYCTKAILTFLLGVKWIKHHSLSSRTCVWVAAFINTSPPAKLSCHKGNGADKEQEPPLNYFRAPAWTVQCNHGFPWLGLEIIITGTTSWQNLRVWSRSKEFLSSKYFLTPFQYFFQHKCGWKNYTKCN